METHDIYDTLKDFLETANCSNRHFAEIAGINPRTFQNMLTRKSALRKERCHAIVIAMQKIIAEDPKNVALIWIQNRFMKESGYSNESITDDMFSALIDATYRTSMQESGELPLSEFERLLNCEQLNDKAPSHKFDLQLFSHCCDNSRLIAAFEKLNEDGQKVAVERVEELAEIPKYKKEPLKSDNMPSDE